MSDKLLSSLRDFSRGINNKNSPTLIDDLELVDAENALIGKGFVQKRHGYVPFAFAPIQQTLTWAGFGAKKWSDL